MSNWDDDELVPDSVESPEKYYRGTIHKLSRSAQRGTVRSASGRNIPFMFMHVTMVGPHRRFDDLQEGQEIGYDVSWTSKGLRVSVVRIPD
jgi:cold shock CspA family protein